MYTWISKLFLLQLWFNGRMFAFKAKDTGSIPVSCILEIYVYLKVPLAYLVEHYISNVKVVGSIPTGSIFYFLLGK